MSDADGHDARPDPADLGFEAAASELETIIARIERGDVGLEESLAEWRRGGALVKRCRTILDAAEQELIRAEESPAGATGTGTPDS
ncbi:MAG: exodeoxyribonuclease VII small subunit [Phycisphaerales bacterium]